MGGLTQVNTSLASSGRSTTPSYTPSHPCVIVSDFCLIKTSRDPGKRLIPPDQRPHSGARLGGSSGREREDRIPDLHLGRYSDGCVRPRPAVCNGCNGTRPLTFELLYRAAVDDLKVCQRIATEALCVGNSLICRSSIGYSEAISRHRPTVDPPRRDDNPWPARPVAHGGMSRLVILARSPSHYN
jgi:hypothetical protein